MSYRIAINGFGRIGRLTLRAALERRSDLEVVAINDLTDPKTLAHLFEFDSVHGRFGKPVSVEGSEIHIGETKIATYQVADPEELPWKQLGVDLVMECTGFFTEKSRAAKHITAGAKQVLISAPGKGRRLHDRLRGQPQ